MLSCGLEGGRYSLPLFFYALMDKINVYNYPRSQSNVKIFIWSMSCECMYAPTHFNFVMFNTLYLMIWDINANSEDLK